MIAHLPQEHRQLHRILQRRSRMAGHEVRDKILLLPQLLIRLLEAADELQICTPVGLAHQVRHPIGDMLRSNLQLTADMILAQLRQEAVPALQQIIKPYTGADEYLLDTRQLPQPSQQHEIIILIRIEIAAWYRRQAGLTPAGTPLQLRLTAGYAEIRRRAAHIVNIPLEARLLRQQLRLTDYRILTAGLNDAPLMGNNGAEIAATEAAALTYKAELHFLQRRDATCRLIHGMICPHVRQIINLIHLLSGKRHGRRILDYAPLTVLLSQPSAPDGILLQILLPKSGGKDLLVRRHLIKGRNLHIIVNIIKIRNPETGTGDILYRLYRRTLLQLCRQRQNLLLTHTIDEQVCRRISQDRPLQPVRPVIIVRKAPQTGLYAADDNRHITEQLPQLIGIDRHRMRRPPVRRPSR